MNGVGLTTVGRLLGHRRRETTAVYAHLDDAALRDAGAPPLPDGGDCDWLGNGEGSSPSPGSHSSSRSEGDVKSGESARNPDIDWLGVNSRKPDSGSQVRDMSESSKGFGLLWI